MKTNRKKLIILLVAAVMVFMCGIPAFAADTVPTIDLADGSYTINAAGNYVVTGSNATNNTLTIQADATVTLKGISITASGNGESAISIESGNVTLIVDGSVNLQGAVGGAGIYVAEGASVTIKDTGAADDVLTAIGNNKVDADDSGAAGIGGTYANGDSGKITIDGAKVVATGYGKHGSGIGSGLNGVSAAITIQGGAEVTAQGGYYSEGGELQSDYGKSDPEGSAGIGGGAKTGKTIGTIKIDGSTVTAYGGSKAAGIGAAFWASVEEIEITGSKVTAYGGSSSAGIGTSRAGSVGVSSTIEITDSIVVAEGGDYGSGIGGGYNGNSIATLPDTSISISGGEVTAVGGMGGAGIGGGYKTDNVGVEISGDAVVSATAGELVEGKDAAQGSASAIGSGANGSGTFENDKEVTIAESATVTVSYYEGGKEAIAETDITELKNVTSSYVCYGTIDSGVVLDDEDDTYIYFDLTGMNTTKESVVIKLYSGETLIATTELVNDEYKTCDELSVKLVIVGTSGSWKTTWEEGSPIDNLVPDKAVLYINGQEVSTTTDIRMYNTDYPENARTWGDVTGVAISPKGTITPGYASNPQTTVTSSTSIWGEGRGNAWKSFVVELYAESGKRIATTSLNNIDGIIDGDVFVTWSMPFDGSNDKYWTVEWAEGYPNINDMAAKVVLLIDGVAVAENNVQLNAADNLKKIVAVDVDADTGVINGFYSNLGAAVANASNVILVNDVTAAQITVENEVSLDLNGHTVNGSFLVKNVNASISNGKIVNTDPSVSAIEIVSTETKPTCTLSLADLDVTSARHAVRVDNANAVIESGTYRVNATTKITTHAVNISGNSNVKINDGKFVGAKGTAADSGASVNVQANSNVSIFGGNFLGGLANTLAAAATGDLTVYGGTFDQDPKAYIPDYFTVDSSNGTYSVTVDSTKTDYVAVVNGYIPYATLEDAIAGAGDSDVISLVTDITVDETITLDLHKTLDLNGKTLTTSKGIAIKGGALVTITSSAEEQGVIHYTGTGDAIYINGAVKELSNVKVDGNGTATSCVKVNSRGRYITLIDTCELIGAKYGISTYKVNKSGDTYLAIGTVKNTTIQASDIGVFLYMSSADAIENCNITGGRLGIALYGMSQDAGYSSTVTVNGSTIVGTTGTAIEISDGSKGYTGYATYMATVNDSTLTGGSGAVYVDMSLLEDGGEKAVGFTPVDTNLACYVDIDGKWTYYASVEDAQANLGDGTLILLGDNVAQVNNINYATLAEAYVAAQSGDTIILLENVSLDDSLVINKDLTLDLGGKTLTVLNGAAILVAEHADVAVLNGTIEAKSLLAISSTTDGAVTFPADYSERLEAEGWLIAAEEDAVLVIGRYVNTDLSSDGKNYELSYRAAGNTNDFTLDINVDALIAMIEARELDSEAIKSYVPDALWNVLTGDEELTGELLVEMLDDAGLLTYDTLCALFTKSIVDETALEALLAGNDPDVKTVLKDMILNKVVPAILGGDSITLNGYPILYVENGFQTISAANMGKALLDACPNLADLKTTDGSEIIKLHAVVTFQNGDVVTYNLTVNLTGEKLAKINEYAEKIDKVVDASVENGELVLNITDTTIERDLFAKAMNNIITAAENGELTAAEAADLFDMANLTVSELIDKMAEMETETVEIILGKDLSKFTGSNAYEKAMNYKARVIELLQSMVSAGDKTVAEMYSEGVFTVEADLDMMVALEELFAFVNGKLGTDYSAEELVEDATVGVKLTVEMDNIYRVDFYEGTSESGKLASTIFLPAGSAISLEIVKGGTWYDANGNVVTEIDGAAVLYSAKKTSGGDTPTPTPGGSSSVTTYTVTFVADGTRIMIVTYKAGQKELSYIPEVPAKEGYIGKWEDFELCDKNIIVNAIYTPATKLIATFVADGVVVAEIPFYAGDTKLSSTPSVPAKTGYSGKWESYKLGTTDITINAIYTAKTYTVNFRSNGGKGTMGLQTLTYDKAEALTANAFTRDGYTFAGWNTKADGTGTSYVDGQSVKNLSTGGDTIMLYAQWKKVEETTTTPSVTTKDPEVTTEPDVTTTEPEVTTTEPTQPTDPVVDPVEPKTGSKTGVIVAVIIIVVIVTAGVACGAVLFVKKKH